MFMPDDENKPFISMNKLAEYMEADAIRRRQIVKDIKKDSDFFKVRYKPVRDILIKYFKNEYDDSLIDKEIEKVEAKKGATSWEEDDFSNTILALKHLKKAVLPDLSDYKVVNDIAKVGNVEISGVTVSIKPDIYLKNIHSGKIGGVKIHIAKTETNRLNETSRQYASVLIKYGFLDKGHKLNDIDNKACISIDIFEENYKEAPSAYKRLLGRLEASCEEIALRWDSI